MKSIGPFYMIIMLVIMLIIFLSVVAILDSFVFNPQIAEFCQQQGYPQMTSIKTGEYCMNNEKGIMHYVRGNCDIVTLKCNPVLYREIVEPYKEAK